MRANAVKREPELQQYWEEQEIYDRLSQNNPGEIFILHDGPPYANGSLHMGHALNKILKDIINKYQLLQGRKVRYVPGWDCHGLPIELKVLQAMKSEERQELTPLKLRQKARKFALKAVEEQSEGFQRYAVWGDWEHPYLTLNPEYEAAQIGVFGQMVLKGYIYRGLKTVHWSPSSRTALAEAELEYPEGHTSRSIYAAFWMTKPAAAVKEVLKPFLPNLGVAIWTTTPWTIPGNLAVAVNPELTYAVVEVTSPLTTPSTPSAQEEDTKPTAKTSRKSKSFGEALTNIRGSGADSKGKKGFKKGKKEKSQASSPKKLQYLLVASALVEQLSEKLGSKLVLKATIKGKDLEHSTYQHPLFNRESEIVIGGDYVTTESGTGLVHTAPGHGQEDFAVGQRYGLPILSPVDAKGNFTKEAEQFAGLNVLGEGNGAVVEALAKAGSLLKEEPYNHKYPYDWRTKKPTIFRATEQWFASVKGFREEALTAIASVNWIPAQGENRITPMVADRSDWCISRQRSWGVPIPVFYHQETGEVLLNQETITHVQAIIAEKGSDAWWELSVAELLPEKYRSKCESYRKGTDTMDVWFDSGSSWAAVSNQRDELRYPADIYLEGSDQHRGWFQSSLLTSVATNNCAPYKTVLTHGFTLDDQGRKMSKSLGNVIDPKIVIEGGKNKQADPPYGADILRLWVSSVDYSSDVPLSKNILKQLSDVYRKIRNTSRFLLGNLHDFDPAEHAVAYEDLPALDQYMLHRITEVFAEITEAFESYQFFRFFQTVQNFCVVDLSNFYLDIAKDRLYISYPDSPRRRSCQTVLAVALENLAVAIAPVLCHLAEDIWQHLPYQTPYQSVFESGWVKLEEQWKNPELATSWNTLRTIRTEVNKVLEQAREQKMIGSSLEAKVLLYVPNEELREQLKVLNPTKTAIVTSTVEPEDPVSSEPQPAVEVAAEVVDESTPLEPEQKQQWESAIQLLTNLPLEVSKFYQDNQRSLVTVGLILATLIVAKVMLEVITMLNHLPLVQPFFFSIGTGYTSWFLWRYLLFAANRQELSEKMREFKQVTVGESTAVVVDIPTEATPPESPEVSYEEKPEVEEVSDIATPAPSEPTNPAQSEPTNNVDELRYLFLASQVELVDSPEAIQNTEYNSQSEMIQVGVVKAEGEKCDRCWNYSTYVGTDAEHSTLCDRCVSALSNNF